MKREQTFTSINQYRYVSFFICLQPPDFHYASLRPWLNTMIHTLFIFSGADFPSISVAKTNHQKHQCLLHPLKSRITSTTIIHDTWNGILDIILPKVPGSDGVPRRVLQRHSHHLAHVFTDKFSVFPDPGCWPNVLSIYLHFPQNLQKWTSMNTTHTHFTKSVTMNCFSRSVLVHKESFIPGMNSITKTNMVFGEENN